MNGRRCNRYGCYNSVPNGIKLCPGHRKQSEDRKLAYREEGLKRQPCRGVGCNGTVRKIEFCDDPGNFTGLCDKCAWAEDLAERGRQAEYDAQVERERAANEELDFFRDLRSELLSSGTEATAEILERLLTHIIEKKESKE